MKVFLCLSLFCAVLYSTEQLSVTVGVLPFTNNSLTNKESLQPLAVGLADMMATELGKIGSLKIVERAKLNKIIDEMALYQSGVLVDESAIEAGKLSGATMLLLGSFTIGFDGLIGNLIFCHTVKAILASSPLNRSLDHKSTVLYKHLSLTISKYSLFTPKNNQFQISQG